MNQVHLSIDTREMTTYMRATPTELLLGFFQDGPTPPSDSQKGANAHRKWGTMHHYENTTDNRTTKDLIKCADVQAGIHF